MCPRTCALGLSSSLLSENKKKTTKVCEIGDRESYFGALFILWIHGKNSHIRTTCKLGGHDLHPKSIKKKQNNNTENGLKAEKKTYPRVDQGGMVEARGGLH